MSDVKFKKIIMALLAGGIVYFLEVNYDNISDITFHKCDNIVSSGDNIIDKKTAILIAQQEVLSSADISENDKWTTESKVVEAFPIHIDGIEGISYYECKVMTNDQDAGYVLVNINMTDLLIPESVTEGITLTESYRKRIGHEDFIIFRYDWFSNVAVHHPDNLSKSSSKILASTGFDDIVTHSQPQKLTSYIGGSQDNFKTFRDSVKSRECFPIYTSNEIKEYYSFLKSEQQIEKLNRHEIGWVKNAWAGKYREIKASLRNTFPCGWHTPQWHQFKKGNGYNIGCGNTAWAIVYAYWKAFKGKDRLFNGYDVMNNCSPSNTYDRPISDCMKWCAKYCMTYDFVWKVGSYKGEKNGFTKPSEMSRGIEYAKKLGYNGTSCRRYQGDEINKFNEVKKYLDADKPVILLIHSSGKGVADHYVVIEEAVKKQKQVIRGGRWRNRDVKYLVNNGDGRTRKWIYVMEVGRNTHENYSAFSAYLINVQ
ncbi:hypothetical protein EH223_13400 [candidate division KSB1 bacterium]|nr:hypothetical protein [candidate division KSB1 bacterium]RQW02044.1 MAG: hypothetical protein EH223_13400 [candidate division KSB1 bacterium]